MSVAKVGLAGIEAAQQGGPFIITLQGAAIPHPLGLSPHGDAGRHAVHMTCGSCRHLNLHGTLEQMHQHEGFGDAATDQQNAMVFKNQTITPFEGLHQALLRVSMKGQAFVGVSPSRRTAGCEHARSS